MTKYNVSYERNGICQTCLVQTNESPVFIGQYFKDVKKADHVYGVEIATADDERPGKPCIEIGINPNMFSHDEYTGKTYYHGFYK